MPTEPRKELSQWDKGRIEGRSESMMEGEIGRQLHIPRRTVSSFLCISNLVKLQTTFLDTDVCE